MKMVLCSIFLVFSWPCFAQDFASADAKFRRRNEFQMLLEARAEYKSILQSSGNRLADYLRAADQYLRTIVFEATHFNKDPKLVEKRLQIYLSCSNQADALTAPSVLRYEYVGYYYFKSRCMLGAMQNAPILLYLDFLKQLPKILDKGFKTAGSDIFEGGGLSRISAALRSDPKVVGYPSKEPYNPSYALKFIDAALQGEAYPDDMEGSLYIENHVEKIRILHELRQETGLSSYSAAASKWAAAAIFDFNDYLRDGLLPDAFIFETQDALEEIGRLEPAAMSNWKAKMELQKKLLADLEVNVDARDAYQALTLLLPAFKAFDTVMKAMVADTSAISGVADSVKVLQQCQEGQENDDNCDTLLDDLIYSKKPTGDQKDKLLTLKNLIDALPEKIPVGCEKLSSDECVRLYLKSYLKAEDIEILEAARNSLAVIKNAPGLYEKYAMRVKKLEEDIAATRHP